MNGNDGNTRSTLMGMGGVIGWRWGICVHDICVQFLYRKMFLKTHKTNQWWSLGDTCFVSRLSPDMVFHVSVLAQSRQLYVLSWLCLEFWHSVSPCLVSHDCVLTVSLSGIARCLFCAETLAFVAESRPLGLVTWCLLAYRKTVVWAVVVVLWL